MLDSIECVGKVQGEDMCVQVGRQFQRDCVEKDDKRRYGQASWPECELVGETETCWWLRECWIDVGLDNVPRSRSWDKTGVIEIGRNLLGSTGFVFVGTGVIFAAFHCHGTMVAAMDRLNDSPMGATKTGSPVHRNQVGMQSRPIAVG